MEFSRNEHAQPPSFVNASYRVGRNTNEVIGFLRGIVADGRISDEEVASLAKLLIARNGEIEPWMFETLTSRVLEALEDDVIDEEERDGIHESICYILGNEDADGVESEPERLVTEIAFTVPEPEIVYDSNVFCFTGRFLYGTRKRCEEEVKVRGGRVQNYVTLQTNYLVVGTVGSEDWRHSTHGTKIITAMDYRSRCDCSLSIVSEKRWVCYLRPA